VGSITGSSLEDPPDSLSPPQGSSEEVGSLSEGPSEELGSWEEEDSLSDGSLCEGSCEEEELGGAVGSWEEELGGSWLLGGAADSPGSGMGRGSVTEPVPSPGISV